MSNDKMRAEFEEAFHQARGQGICVAEDRSVAWAFFAASRESLVVPHFCGYKFEGCQYYDADSVDEALEDLGLKVQP